MLSRLPRIVYIVISSREVRNNESNRSNEPPVRLRALRRGWLGHVRSTDVLVWSTDQTLHRKSSSRLEGGLNGALMFEALRTSRSHNGVADWYMFADDDTHVDPSAVEEFISSKANPALAYGNLYHNVTGRGNPKPWCRAARGARFRLQHSWFTGGSGVLLAGQVADRLIANTSSMQTWAAASSSCQCFDVPLACALTDLGIGMRHAPHLFLDSCLSCADWLSTAPRRILSCHATSAFKSYNVHAKRKGPRDQVHLRNFLKLRHRRGYHWPANLSSVAPEDRMEEVRINLCAPRPPLVQLTTAERSSHV